MRYNVKKNKIKISTYKDNITNKYTVIKIYKNKLGMYGPMRKALSNVYK